MDNFNIGSAIAEDETGTLHEYFLETNQWKKVYSGGADLIKGPKGSGKSAIYCLLKKHENDFIYNGIHIISAENLRGASVFRQLSESPPKDERSFLYLWKLYFLVITIKHLESDDKFVDSIDEIRNVLQQEGLLPSEFSLVRALRSVLDFFAKKFRSVEGGVEIDPITTLPKLSGKLVFDTPSEAERRAGIISVDDLLAGIQDIMQSKRSNIWIIIDRLDVVFDGNDDLERMALRSLLRVYIDFFAYESISIKMFLRDDLWNKITSGGFREASHVTKIMEITWSKTFLVNLLLNRLLKSPYFSEVLEVNASKTMAHFNEQVHLFNSLFEDNLRNREGFKTPAADWLISQTADGKGINTPRDLIQMLIYAHTHEMRRLERGEHVSRGNRLFSAESLMEAIRKVSKYKIEQTLFAEYPEIKAHVYKIAEARATRFDLAKISNILELDSNLCRPIIDKLVEIGFLAKTGVEAYAIPRFYEFGLGLEGK